MRRLNYELTRMVRTQRSGSFATVAARGRILNQCATELHDLGFRNLTARGLRTKHVQALVKHWSNKDLSAGTIKNRMAHVRWWAQRIGKPGVVAADNAAYGIADRRYVTNRDKSQTLDERINRISDDHVRMSLRLQAAFGLRREEAIKFRPTYADRGNHLTLKASWTKGGKSREIPIRNDAQRDVLRSAHELAGNGSLIPSEKRYVDQLRIYERHTNRAGMNKLHGLRHAYAQTRYYELTGWQCPAKDGPRRRALKQNERDRDSLARLTISRELGHERIEIVAVYLGS